MRGWVALARVVLELVLLLVLDPEAAWAAFVSGGLRIEYEYRPSG
jgi:hypothetical protein